jgi:RimJ/RimL family protein N-acetyltransferase
MKNSLQGKLIRLTSFTEKDMAQLIPWYQDVSYMRLIDAISAIPKRDKDLKKWIEEVQDSPEGAFFAIRPAEGEALLGFAQLEGILWNQQTGWVAIGIGDPANRGQGFGREALTLLINFAFNELNLRRVQLTVFSYNKNAIALYKKLGFQYEGAFREFLHRDGQFYDMLFYGLLRREWVGQNNPTQVD